jgi:GH3 auxin-responsive promoter
MQLLLPAVRWFLEKPYPRIEYFMKHPYEVQDKMFHSLLLSAKNTEWGRKYEYASIKNYEQYQKKVPVSSYEDFSPHIEKMMQGERNILWQTPVKWFSKSSGTTNARSKFIPVSQEALQRCHFQGGRDLMALYVHNHPKTKAFIGKGLSIGGSFQESPTKGIYYGDVSAVMLQQLPKWVQLIRTPKLSTAILPKWEEKIEMMAQETLSQNVTNILGVPTWTIVLLQRILEITGKKHIKEVWGNLECFFHGAVSFQPYKELFNTLAPDINYMEVYNASEGFFALQDDLSRDDMLLMLDYGIFYEFIPLDEIDNPYPKSYTLDEVELDTNYAMVISTNAGLWRYKIGDTVKFTSKFPYRIKISGRTKHFINAFGEELMVENADTAITAACKATNAAIINFTACPIYIEEGKKGGHEWILEFERQPSDLQKFTEVLDETLREINSDYDAKRYQDMALQMPVVHNVPSGTFYNWLKMKGKLGGQYKVPRLANSREFVDEILGMIEYSK